MFLSIGAQVHLTCQNKGSVEHYYHFVLGLLVPLLGWLGEQADSTSARRVYIRSCSDFDPLLQEVGIQSVKILNRRLHGALRRARWVLPVTYLKLDGLDKPSKYDAMVFHEARQVLFARLAREIQTESVFINKTWIGVGQKVLLIDRGPPSARQMSSAAEKSGVSRRSVPNMAHIEASLRSMNVNLRAEKLEGKSLAYQAALFRESEVIIAQHGAALANLIWARPQVSVVEIVPDEGSQSLDHFSELARCLGHNYRRVRQSGKHSAVDVAGVVEALKQLEEPSIASWTAEVNC